MNLVSNSWSDDNVNFFNILSSNFSDAADYHHSVSHRWKTVNTICNLIMMCISLSTICIEVLYNGTKFVRYYGFCDKIIVVLVTSFIFAVNPADLSGNHDKSCSSYLELVSRINIQLNRSVETRKPVEMLLGEIKYRYDIIIERTYPPKHLRLPFGVNHLSKVDPHVLKDLSMADV